MPNSLPKTVILAIATLLLAVAVLVTDLVSPYAGSVDSAASVGSPFQVQNPGRAPARSPATAPAGAQVRELASNTAVSTPFIDAI